jgi:hypothetical protein
MSLVSELERLRKRLEHLEVSIETPSGTGSTHNPVTLDADAENLLGLSVQEIGLDDQVANIVFAGPSAGAAAAPDFRALVAADIPTHDIEAKHTTTEMDTSLALSPDGAGGVEWSATGTGDMTKAVYDTDDNGVVDNAEQLGGVAAADYLTEAEHTAIGDASPHHAAVTLSAAADTVFSLATQEIGLDDQVANTVFAGPSAGADAAPTFRALVVSDIPSHASTHESGGADTIDHDNLVGFAANEHIDHTSVTLTAGDGLTGGGTIAASRSFALATPGTLSAASSNDASGNHTHAITATADGDTNTSTILQSGSNGDLRIDRLGVGVAAIAASGTIALPDAGYIGNGSASARLGFDSSGATDYAYFEDCNVGVGTTSPGAKLEIDTSSGEFIRIGDSSEARDFYIDNFNPDYIKKEGNLVFAADPDDSDANTVMTFRIDDDEKMRIDSDGNVGIGTTSPDDYSGSKALVLSAEDTTTGSAIFTLRSKNTTTGGIYFADTNTGEGRYDGAINYDHVNKELRLWSNYDDGSNDIDMVIDSDGNVGINETDPAYRLDIDDGAMRYAEMTAPSAPAANSFVQYAEDAGSDTAACIKFNGGHVVTIAIDGGIEDYNPSNVTADRTFDADSTTLAEIADVLGTLIVDLQKVGTLGEP